MMVVRTSSPIEVCSISAEGGFAAARTAKKLGNINLDLHLLQPFEIAQNRQNILWKSLALEPQKFGNPW
jgi:hypothetical protein